MRVLIITQYFPPEIEAGAFRMHDLGKRLAAKGHEVYILTGMPNFPTGIKPKEYKYRTFMKENMEGIHCFRSYVFPTENRGLIKRLINYFSFVLSSMIASIRIPCVDVVVTTSPPLFSGVSGLFISKILRRVPFVFEVRDLWPESAAVLGLISNPIIIWVLSKLEGYFYRYADSIVAVTSGITDSLLRRVVPPHKIIYIPNGVDPNIVKPGEKLNRVRKELKIEDKFIVLYAGTHGVAQRLQTLLESAKILRDWKEILFIFIGEGAEKRTLKEQAGKDKLENVLFLDQVPKSEIVDYISASDVCVVLLRKLDLFLGAVPSKLYEFMAAERPVILGIDGEAKKILEDAQAGIAIEPENAEELAQAILMLKSNPQLMDRFGKNGRIAVEQKFSRDALAERYERLLADLVTNA